jgi:hypothetical protein
MWNRFSDRFVSRVSNVHFCTIEFMRPVNDRVRGTWQHGKDPLGVEIGGFVYFQPVALDRASNEKALGKWGTGPTVTRID